MKISVIIAHRNRCDDLRITLNKYLEQTYSDKEIIVIDNASFDGTPDMMRTEFPNVKYLWLTSNIDLQALNVAFAISSGEIIWRCDNDSFPEKNDCFERIIEIFEKYEDIGIIATEDIEVGRGYRINDWYPLKADKINVPEKGYVSNTFYGTGVAIRREVYEKTGGFGKILFEELEFSTKAIAAGYNIRYFPNIRVEHHNSPAERVKSFYWVRGSKNLIAYHWKYFPFFLALWNSILVFFFQIITGLFQRVGFWTLLEGIFAMPAAAIEAFRCERHVLDKQKIRKVTLGKSQFSYYTDYYSAIIRSKLQKRRNRLQNK